MSFENKVVLITGASSGIGSACAVKFAKLSASLSLVGRNVDNLKQTKNQCKEISGLKPVTIVADICLDEDIAHIVKETVDRYGKIDVLINNAGVSVMSGIYSEAAAFDRVMATNVRATYLLTNRVLPFLIKTKGNIVNVSSVLSTKPLPIMTPYCMSKAAIDIFTKCLAFELGPQGVRVNAINPGPVKTEFFKRSGMNEDLSIKMFNAIEMKSPLRKITKGDDVAELVTFLASERADCITGCCYVIDCGITLGDVEQH